MKKKKLTIDDMEEKQISKSAKKRESQKLQKLGEELAKLSNAQRNGLDLSQELREAFLLYDKISDREGKRRQMQFIGRLLREEEEENIQKIYLGLTGAQNAHYENVANFQIAEKFRTRLLEAGENELKTILNELYARGMSAKNSDENLPSFEELEEIVKKARKNGAGEAHDGKNYSRQLFKKIIEIIR